jgi:hypothetical protein
MPVSGRRYAALQRQAAEQRADILRLERDLTTVTGERDAAREIIRGLSDRNRELRHRGQRLTWTAAVAAAPPVTMRQLLVDQIEAAPGRRACWNCATL